MDERSSGRVIGWLNKVPEVTLAFWTIKILSTTVGETGADFLAVNAGWGKGPTQAVMAALLAVGERPIIPGPRDQPLGALSSSMVSPVS